MKKLLWITWLFITIGLGIYFYFKLTISEDKTELLIGDTTYGHYQIEMECSACHTDPFGGKEVLQDACVNCHEAELEAAHDSHPKKKFTDPREAYRLEIIDARYCINCHTEHHKDRTHPMGVTIPDDYCYHCHKEVGEERESHKDLPFDSCASAGCHNFHDNRALYEEFLVSNANQPWLSEIAKIASPTAAKEVAIKKVKPEAPAFEKQMAQFSEQTHQWQASSHAAAGVNCGGCHTNPEDKSTWLEKPTIVQCQQCHEYEVETFTSGKHGMRLSETLNLYQHGISPKESDLSFTMDSLDVQHGCNSCHGAHSFDTKTAAVESCLNCHTDKHSQAFNDSPHGKLWSEQSLNSTPLTSEEVVTCATCHMPRVEKNINGNKVIAVNHNQNDNLRPNEKMIRSVCMDCHGLEFTIDSLADPKLIENNFSGKPGIHIESIDWSIKRIRK